MGENRLYYGDNLDILRRYMADECVDLIYLDPPFNSNRSYNVLFKDESGRDSDAQITAFEDTWSWGPQAEQTYFELVTDGPERVQAAIGALRQIVGTNPMMAYLVMMAARLVELHRVLKQTGALYLHCDATSSHYLKMILDTIFGVEQFVNEIVWKRTSAHSDIHQGALHLGRVHDVIFFYAKPEHMRNAVYQEYSPEYIAERFTHIEEGTGRRYKTSDMTGPGGEAKGNPQYEVLGVTRYWRYSKEKMNTFLKEGRIHQASPGSVPRLKQYFDEMSGIPLQDVWDDIAPVNSQANERLGYPTQKPLALLERIIEASSNPGDVVLDPFAGCGTAIAAAQKLGRQWVGIDITHLSIALLKYRMKDMFGLEAPKDYQVIGEPEDEAGARQLASEDRYQFQFWALSLIPGAKPLGGQPGSRQGKKGSDKGIDGVITFIDRSDGKPERIVIQVKSGHVKSGDVRDLKGTMEREGAAMGVFVTLEAPTRDMATEAVSAGFYRPKAWEGQYPRMQILTIAELLAGKRVEMPAQRGGYKQAERVQDEGPRTMEMFGEEED